MQNPRRFAHIESMCKYHTYACTYVRTCVWRVFIYSACANNNNYMCHLYSVLSSFGSKDMFAFTHFLPYCFTLRAYLIVSANGNSQSLFTERMAASTQVVKYKTHARFLRSKMAVLYWNRSNSARGHFQRKPHNILTFIAR